MKLKVKAILTTIMLVGQIAIAPLERIYDLCTSTAVSTVVTPSGAVASKKTYKAFQLCMAMRFAASALNRLQPSFLLAPAWPMGQAIELSIAEMQAHSNTQARRQLFLQLAGLEYYWDPASHPPGYSSTIRTIFESAGVKYYDDNAWLGIALMELYNIFHQSWMLERATEVLALDMYGAVGTQDLPRPGGVFWTQEAGNRYRATVSTAGAVQLALELYRITGHRDYLDFAMSEFDWVNINLRTEKGLYRDGVNADGSLIGPEYSYNQGLMIGDAALLYVATGDEEFLKEAEAIARAAITWYGADDNLWEQDPVFNAIFFKNLLLLAAFGGHSDYEPLMQRYAKRITKNLDSIGLFIWRGENGWLEQAAAVQILADLVRPLKDFE